MSKRYGANSHKLVHFLMFAHALQDIFQLFTSHLDDLKQKSESTRLLSKWLKLVTLDGIKLGTEVAHRDVPWVQIVGPGCCF